MLPALAGYLILPFTPQSPVSWEEMVQASGPYPTVHKDSLGSFWNLLGPTWDPVNQNPGVWAGMVGVVMKLRRFYLLKPVSERKEPIIRGCIHFCNVLKMAALQTWRDGVTVKSSTRSSFLLRGQFCVWTNLYRWQNVTELYAKTYPNNECMQKMVQSE